MEGLMAAAAPTAQRHRAFARPGRREEDRQMDKVRELEQMLDALRRQREVCEPKSNQNPCYLRYSNAVSALRWIIGEHPSGGRVLLTRNAAYCSCGAIRHGIVA